MGPRLLLGGVLLAAMLAGCGGASRPGSTPADPTTTTVPTATSIDGNAEGGFGPPAQAPGEFAIEGEAKPVRGELLLTDNGCWYVTIAGSAYLIVFPEGFETPQSDATVVASPDGVAFEPGALVDGTAHQLAFAELPGGADGRWGNYTSFCDPEEQSVAVFESVEPGFNPEALTAEEIRDMVAGAAFTRYWPCGRGWAVSTEDELVALFIYQQADLPAPPDAPITLPHEAWRAELVVGKHLFVNHCDDVSEPWEPLPVVAAQWQLSSGTLALLDTLPVGADSAQVRAILSEATVTTGTGERISLGQIDLLNTAFNVFAG